jgi:transcription-repair coupling factor (superfamily II helicase)
MEKEGESKWKKREKKIDESIKDYISDLLRINLK